MKNLENTLWVLGKNKNMRHYELLTNIQFLNIFSRLTDDAFNNILKIDDYDNCFKLYLKFYERYYEQKI